MPTHSPNNPFATRWVRPGAIDYHFPAGESAARLVERLRAQHWCGAITGPHGAGKSTLLASLLPALRQAGREVLVHALHDGQRRLPAELADPSSWTPQTQIMVDGYEQLSYFSRARLRRRCRRAGCGLLVTAHASVDLPTLLHVEPSLALAQQLAAQLTRDAPPLIHPDDVRRAYEHHHGNLRDTLFALYDVFEQRRA